MNNALIVCAGIVMLISIVIILGYFVIKDDNEREKVFNEIRDKIMNLRQRAKNSGDIGELESIKEEVNKIRKGIGPIGPNGVNGSNILRWCKDVTEYANGKIEGIKSAK